MTMLDLHKRIIDYWDNQPCNIKHSDKTVGTQEFFEENSERRYFVEPHIKEFAQFHEYQGKRVLEIGCGIGADAAEFVKHGADYTGIDISAASVQLSEQRFDCFGLPGKFHVMSAMDNLTSLGEFDMVYSMGVLHHYPDIDQAIKNIHQVLVPQGEFKFMVYAKHSWKYAMIQKGLDQFEAQAGCPYAKAYSREQIYHLVSGLFNIGRIRQSHCFMYNVAQYRRGSYELEPWFEIMPEAMREALREYLGWHLLVKCSKI